MTPSGLVFRACSSLDDFRQCLRLQKQIWGFDDLETLPTRVFVVAQEIGGQIFGAFEESRRESGGECGRIVGFLLALPGLRHGQPFFHSHMLGVLPDYRDRGVGRQLKIMQRDDALSRGVPLVEWTFDPLEAKNAFFNIARLGVIVRRYVPNRYGITTSDLHGGLPTDRLVAEWWVGTARVQAAMEGRPAEMKPEQRIEVPAEIAEVKKHDRERARDMQSRIRAGFQEAFAAGLAVVGFDPAGAYLLARLPEEFVAGQR